MPFTQRTALYCLLSFVALSVVGCATIQNTVRSEDVATFKLIGVNVSYLSDATIAWDDPLRAYAVAKSIPDDQLAMASNSPEARIFSQNYLAPRIKSAVERHLSSRLAGTRPVRLEIVVHSFVIASAVQRAVIGGSFIMVADANLIDARTGATIVTYPKLVAAATAGNGIIGVAVQAAVEAGQGTQPADRLVNAYAEQYASWLLRK